MGMNITILPMRTPIRCQCVLPSFGSVGYASFLGFNNIERMNIINPSHYVYIYICMLCIYLCIYIHVSEIIYIYIPLWYMNILYGISWYIRMVVNFGICMTYHTTTMLRHKITYGAPFFYRHEDFWRYSNFF